MNHVLFFSLTGKRWERALWSHRVATYLRMNDWDAEVVDFAAFWQLEELQEDYRIDIWHDEYNKIPKYFLNNQFCNTGIIKKDIETFLSYPEVRELLKIID